MQADDRMSVPPSSFPVKSLPQKSFPSGSFSLSPLFPAVSRSTASRPLVNRLLVVIMLALTVAISQPALAQDRPDSFAGLAEKLSPSVVNISTTVVDRETDDTPQFPPNSPFEDFFKEFEEREGRRRIQALGSGFIITAEGVIVTNNHVIDGADEIRVTLANDRTFDATLIGRDTKTDIALLKINPDNETLHPVPFGNSDEMRVGDWVVAIGNPFGLGGSVTAGIISARGRDIGSGPYDDFLQTDAAINRGNSGGPLFNLDGEVIGINTAIFSQSGGSVGVGFAIASNLASNVVDQLRDYGKTRRGWLGVFVQAITPEIAENFNLENENGALVSSVHPGSPAEEAGIKAGDVVTTFDGNPVDEMRSLPRIVAESTIGEPLSVEVIRDGEPLRLEVTLGVLEEAEQGELASRNTGRSDGSEPFTIERLGMTIVSIDDALRQEYSIGDDVTGVVITAIDPESSTASQDVLAGDVIRRVGKRQVEDLESAIDAINAEIEADKPTILLLVSRQGRDRFVAIPLN